MHINKPMEIDRDDIAMAIYNVVKWAIVAALDKLRDEPRLKAHGAYQAAIDVTLSCARSTVHSYGGVQLVYRLITLRQQLIAMLRIIEIRALHRLMVPGVPTEIVLTHTDVIYNLITVVDYTIDDIRSMSVPVVLPS